MDTVVIGAGQAGLATSRWLAKKGIAHVVLERGRIGQSWRSQRWDSFHLNTPNAINRLPDDPYQGPDPDGFCAAGELLAYFEQYAAVRELPVVEGARVTAVRRFEDGFEVVASDETRSCRNLVLCSGDQNTPVVPSVAEALPEDLLQLHCADYRRPEQLPAGATLVVGSAQSGVQIAEDLLEAGRQVYLCTSKVGRIPRRYRGKDITTWLRLAGLAEQRPEDLEDPSELHARQGQVSGTHGGHTVSLPQLARDGVKLLGRLEAVKGRTLLLGDDLEANAAKGDELSAKLRGGIDMFIEKAGLEAPQAEADPAEEPFAGLADMAAVRELDLREAGIRSVIWATGFGPDFSYLEPSLLDERGRPRHQGGVCAVPGLYCVGLTWLRRRISGLVAGVDADAAFVATKIAERSA